LNAEAFIGLGGNLGEVRATFEQALREIEGFASLSKLSSLYRSKPFGFGDQPDFLNAVIKVNTALDPFALLYQLQAIERELGKEVIRENGPRTIDLDLLLYGGLVLDTKGLRLPHPGIVKRDFVLMPLAEIEPELIHPTLNRSTQNLLSDGFVSQYVFATEKASMTGVNLDT
jgi:2-amino-4-hydroxy-6-hydroxymethyldihydropteridine diphosphokinase